MAKPPPRVPVDRDEPALTPFDKSVDAIVSLLSHPSRRLLQTDELRRAVGSLAPADGHRLADYERRLQGIHDLLLEKDIFGDEEIMLKCAALREEITRAPISDPGDAPSLDYVVLERAVREMLVAKGVFTADEWRQQMERRPGASG